MNTDLFNHYQSLPTSELLVITRRPDDYTPEAVATAHQVLNQRVVTPADEPPPPVDKIDVLAPLRAKVDQLRLDSTEGFRPERWLPVFLVIYAVKISWSFVNDYRIVRFAIKDGSFEILWFLPIELLPLLVLYLLYKRRAWGWILLFALSIMWLLGHVMSSYYSFKIVGISNLYTLPNTIIHTIIDVAIIACLWRQDVAALFKIQPKTKLLTVLVTCGLALGEVIFGLLS